MKKIILDFEEMTEDFKELVQEAFNKDILNFLVSERTFPEFEAIERVNVYSKILKLNPQYRVYTDKQKLMKEISEGNNIQNLGFHAEIKTKEDELQIVELSRTGYVDFIIVSAKDWKIIPFENLIAEMHSHETDLIAEVEDINEARLMLKTLEVGVDGIVMKPQNANDIIKLKNLMVDTFQIELAKARVMKIESVPEAERVCVDTTSLLNVGEGMLVGSTASGFCLIHSETFETQFVSSRPFRVNAGDVSAYILVPDETSETLYRTSYLSELKGGKKVLAVNYKGDARTVSVGRVKIETRPMLRFELEIEKESKIIPISCICQNAETIRLVDPNGKAKSVVDIKIGDEVLVHVGPAATHFGTAINEKIIEK
ncbi:MAG: 3-dehydroquinate synthase II [Promethearchaeota archaeon]|nr:MAG: 3-dehydroquinate synthase II [Candidatus Lokiarchaeota archaeon]